ncbi:MAG: S9 family peptidase [Bacteroidales bacterium]|nr:S9 family peptidase [Bacteroidales bacterium]
MKARQLLIPVFLVAACALVGLGIGVLFKTMNTNKEESEGYIGPQDVEITDGRMTPETLLALGRLNDPQLSPDGQKILYGVTYQSVAENKACRNLYLCNADGSGNVQLTRYARSVRNARWSADGKSIYFVMFGQIYKAPLRGNRLGKRVRLTGIPNRVGEFKISPDEKYVMFTSTIKNTAVERPVDSDPMLDKADAYATEDLMYRHWDHWVTEVPRTYVAKLGEGEITLENSTDILCTDELFELPTEPFGGIEQLDWAPDSRHIAYSCRKKTGKRYAFSTNTSIYIFDVETRQTTAVTSTGGYDTDPVWNEDGSRLAWISMARDGYEADQQRLLVADIRLGDSIEVGEIRDLSADFDYDVSGPVWHGDKIYFSALVSEAVQGLFRVGPDGNVERLTPADWWTDFFSPFAILDKEDGIKILTTYYSLEFPAELVSVDIAGGKASCSRITGVNDGIFAKLDNISEESVLVETVDGKQMQCWVVYPPKFDASKVYPAIEIVLGGPQGSNSQDWSYRWCYRLMAQQGYIVILPNRRGTTAFGQEWKEQISGDYPGLNMQDYLSAGRYIKSQPYVGKLACVGASYGGYSAYMLEGLHGDLYDCFIAHAGIFDEKQLWFTTEEMWFANWDNGGLTEYAYNPEAGIGPAGDGITFGGMQQAGAPYASTPKAQRHYANSPSSMVTKWHTPILCIHGGMDFRIPSEQGMAAFNAAQMMGVPSKLIIFPEETHWVLRPQNALYWHRNFFDWLDKWCKE